MYQWGRLSGQCLSGDRMYGALLCAVHRSDRKKAGCRDWIDWRRHLLLWIWAIENIHPNGNLSRDCRSHDRKCRVSPTTTIGACSDWAFRVIQSIMGDISDETNQGIGAHQQPSGTSVCLTSLSSAFSLSTATWNIGAMIGPLIGGVLYHPAERYPSVFGGVQFLRSQVRLHSNTCATVLILFASLSSFRALCPSSSRRVEFLLRCSF